jgi:hypothetical protein
MGTVVAEHGWRFRRTVPSLPEVHRSVTVANGPKVIGYFASCSPSVRADRLQSTTWSGELGYRAGRDAN